jgi:hypothetical protein
VDALEKENNYVIRIWGLIHDRRMGSSKKLNLESHDINHVYLAKKHCKSLFV